MPEPYAPELTALINQHAQRIRHGFRQMAKAMEEITAALKRAFAPLIEEQRRHERDVRAMGIEPLAQSTVTIHHDGISVEGW